MSRTTARRLLGGLAALSLPLVMAGCQNQDTPQNTFKPEGPFSRVSYDLIKPVFAIAAFVFVFVQGLILYAIIAFRRRSDDDRPQQIHGSTAFEAAWTIIPALILVFVGFGTVSKVFYLDKQFKGAMQVEVIGHQWWWEYNYSDDSGKVVVRTANELHIPVGRKVQLNLKSGDVIHNFWPPKLAGKIYAIPGRTNHMTIESEKPEFYYGQCAEYCGLSHANMRLRVVSQTPADFEAWLKANDADKPSKVFPTVTAANTDTATEAEKGATLFLQKGCSGCHAVNGIAKGAVGPNLTYFNSRATFAGAIFENTDDNLRAWLRDAPAEKPGSLMPNLNLSESEITSLTAYLRTLGDPAQSAVDNSAGQAAGKP